ncbi:MAG: hypothetical protein K6G80_05140 [Treponema sp.]|nr:hypothetical protein [Treponema sp.]
MKLTGIFIVPLAAFLSLAMLTACSNDTVEVASLVEKAVTENAEGAVSLEDTTLYGDLMNARFVGAHTAYITLYDSTVSEEENLYTYSATGDTLTLTLRKIAAPDGSGRLLTQDEYIGWWNSQDFKLSNIITDDVTSWYWKETLTVTDTESTVYTFTNKTTYTRSGDAITEEMTTCGIKKPDGGTETELFTDVTGYTEIESKYSASEFTNVVTVHVYEVTTKIVNEEEEVSVAPYTGYPLELGTATVGESESDIGSDDADTQEEIDEREGFFESRYEQLSANDWLLVKTAFMPQTFSYEKDKTVTRSALNDDGTYEYYDVTYDYYLTQRYTAAETALFMYTTEVTEDLEAFSGTVAVFSGYSGSVTVVENGETTESYLADTLDTENKTLAFVVDTGNDEYGSITATYSLNENGDNTTLTLAYETKDGFTVSGETITLEYSSITSGLMIID